MLLTCNRHKIRLQNSRHKPGFFFIPHAPGKSFKNATSFSERIKKITRKSSARLALQEGNGNSLVILSHNYQLLIEQMLIGESQIHEKSSESRLDKKDRLKISHLSIKRTEDLSGIMVKVYCLNVDNFGVVCVN